MKMNILSFIAILLFVASASASIFGGDGVKPDNNPVVDKYHTDSSDWAEILKRLAIYIVVGVLGSLFILTVTLIFYTYRFCRTCLCCCIKSCRVKHTRPRSESLERELMNANPVVSWVLRAIVTLLFFLVFALIVVGFVASSEVHKNISETTATFYNAANNYNQTVYHINATMSHIRSINYTQDDLNNFNDWANSSSTLVNITQTLNKEGPRIDSIRRNTTVSVYVLAFVPMLIGLVGAIIGRGRLTFIMSMVLPWIMIGCWILFAFHYSMFVINVDVCFEMDKLLVANYTDNTTQTTTSGIELLNCSYYSKTSDPILSIINLATVITEADLNQTTDPSEREQLTSELVDLRNLTAVVQEWADCSGVTSIMNVAYPDICGKAIEASLFLWRSQVGLVIVLLITCIVGIVGENKIVARRDKKKKDDYSTLALLN